jgi:putative ABC transport system permease protein
MIDNETWTVAIRALLANKIKAALTMLGVTIGSACIVLVVSVTLVGQAYVISQIEGIGSNLIYAYYPGNQISQSVADEISINDLDRARELPHVREVAGAHDIGNATVVISGKPYPVALIGVTQAFQQIRNLAILEGRYFDDIDMATHAKGCLITPDLASHFDHDMLGSFIHIGELQFSVIGIFRERVGTFGESEIATDSVLIPLSLIKTYGAQDYLRTLYVQSDSPENVTLVTDEIREMLTSQHRKGLKYQVENLSAILEATRRISRALTIVLMILGCITLLISGIGIMNIMLVTVTERTSEIGLRRAVGARKREILNQFLIEAFLISGLGALLGILIAISVTSIVRWFVPADYALRIPISSLSILISFVVSSGIGILFGYLPAQKASVLEPTEALHHE